MLQFMGKRTPGNPAVRNRAACWRLFDEVADILSETVDPKIMHVPMHPDDAFAK